MCWIDENDSHFTYKRMGELKENFEECTKTSSIYRASFYPKLLDDVIIHTSKVL